MMEPLRITFHLDTPMVSPGYPLHLDALLAYAVTAKAIAANSAAERHIREIAEVLPLAFEERDGNRVWKASALLPTVQGEQGVRLWTRKTDPYDFAARAIRGEIELATRTRNALADNKLYAGKVDTARGLMKNMFQFYPTTDIKELTAWCIGDVDQIDSLLAPESGLITHLGKRGRIGHGRIIAVNVEYDERAESSWKNRVLPWKENDEYVPIVAAFKPPYWAPENRKSAFIPGSL